MRAITEEEGSHPDDSQDRKNKLGRRLQRCGCGCALEGNESFYVNVQRCHWVRLEVEGSVLGFGGGHSGDRRGH